MQCAWKVLAKVLSSQIFITILFTKYGLSTAGQNTSAGSTTEIIRLNNRTRGLICFSFFRGSVATEESNEKYPPQNETLFVPIYMYRDSETGLGNSFGVFLAQRKAFLLHFYY